MNGLHVMKAHTAQAAPPRTQLAGEIVACIVQHIV